MSSASAAGILSKGRWVNAKMHQSNGRWFNIHIQMIIENNTQNERIQRKEKTPNHYSDAPLALTCLKSQAKLLFAEQLVQTDNKGNI